MNRSVKTPTRFAAIVAALTLGFFFTNLPTHFDQITPSTYATNFKPHKGNEISPSFVSRTGENSVLPANQQKLETKRVSALFPMARDAQEISVTIENGEMIYQDDLVIDPSQVINNGVDESERKVDLVLRARRALTQQQGPAWRLFSAGTATWGINWGRWPDGIIPYKVRDDMPQDREISSPRQSTILTPEPTCVFEKGKAAMTTMWNICPSKTCPITADRA